MKRFITFISALMLLSGTMLAATSYCNQPIKDVKLSIHSVFDATQTTKVRQLIFNIAPNGEATVAHFRNYETCNSLSLNGVALVRGTDFTWVHNGSNPTSDADADWQTADEFTITFATAQDQDLPLNIGVLSWKTDVTATGWSLNISGFTLGGQCCRTADTSAPTLTATAGVVSDTWATINVSATDVDGCGDPQSVSLYEVNTGSGYVTYASSGSSIKVTGLTANTNYTLQVRAIDMAGNRSAVASIPVTTLAFPLSDWCQNTLKANNNNPANDALLSIESLKDNSGKIYGVVCTIAAVPGNGDTKFRNKGLTTTNFTVGGSPVTIKSTSFNADMTQQTVLFGTTYNTGDQLSWTTTEWTVGTDGPWTGATNTVTLGGLCCANVDNINPTLSLGSAMSSDTKILVQTTASDQDGCGNAWTPQACMVSVNGGAAKLCFMDGAGVLTIDGLTPSTTYNFSIQALDKAGNVSTAQALGPISTSDKPLSEFCNTLFSYSGAPIYMSVTTLWDSLKTAVNGVYFKITPYGTDTLANFRGNGISGALRINGTELTTSEYTRFTQGNECYIMFTTPRAVNDVFTWGITEWTCTTKANPYTETVQTFTLGNNCDTGDTDKPVISDLLFEKAGLHAFSFTIVPSDDVLGYWVELTTSDGVYKSLVKSPHTGGAEQIFVQLPETITLPLEAAQAWPFKVYAFDKGSNYSNTLSAAAYKNTIAPTSTASCGFGTNSSVIVRINGTQGTGGCVVKYRALADPGTGTEVEFKDLEAQNNTITLAGLEPDKEYEIQVFAVDEYGNEQESAAVTSCTTIDSNPYCGTLFSNANRPFATVGNYNSRMIFSISADKVNKVLTFVLADYPGGKPVSGAYIDINGTDTNPSGGNTHMKVNPMNTAEGNFTYPDLGTLTNFSNNPAATAEWINITYSEEPGITHRALKLTCPYSGTVESFFMRWYVENPDATYGHSEAVMFNKLALDLDYLTCDMTGNVIDAQWRYGNPEHLDTPTNLDKNAISTDPLTNPHFQLDGCDKMLWGTTFSPKAGVTAQHLSLNQIDVIDNTGNIELRMGKQYSEGYTNGGFMSAATRSYAIVSNPSVLDPQLKQINDGVNRLVYNLPKMVYGTSDTLLALFVDHMAPDTYLTVQFDYEELTPECDENDLMGRLLEASICGKVGTASESVDSLYVSMQDGHGDVTEYRRTDALIPMHIASTGTVSISGKTNGIKDAIFIKVDRSEDCSAVAISNLRVYGCLKPYISSSVQDTVLCEGTDLEMTAYAVSEDATGYTWEKSEDEGANYTTMTETDRTITVEATTGRVYYRVSKGSVTTDPFVVQGIVCCADTNIMWSEDFGTVGVWKRLAYPNGDATKDYVVGHAFQDLIWTKDISGNDSLDAAASRIDDGDYAIISNSTYANQYVPWKPNRYDHTGNPNGGYLLINVGSENTKTQIIQKDIKGPFCENVWYNFSMWASQLANYGENPSHFVLEIWEIDENGVDQRIASQFETGDMDVFEMDAWRHYSLSVVTKASVPALRIKVFNMGLPGTGNDLVLDDLNFSRCIPVVNLYADYKNLQVDKVVECGDKDTLTAVFEGVASSYFKTTPYYTWQKTLDNGATWIMVADTILGGDTCVIRSTNPDGEYFRCVVSASAEIGHKVAMGETVGNCDIYVITNLANVACAGGCFDPEIESFTASVDKACSTGGAQTFTVKVKDKQSVTKGDLTTVYGVDSYNYQVHYPGAAYGAVETHSSTNLTDTYNYTPTDTLSVFVKVTNTDKCYTTAELQLPVLPTLDAPADTIGKTCQGAADYDMAQLVPDKVGYTVVWYDATGTNPLASAPQQSTAATGTFNYQAAYKSSDAPYCEGQKGKIGVTVQAKPTATISGNNDFTCVLLADTLKADVADATLYTYLWSNGSTADTAIVKAKGTYNLKITEIATGCTSDPINVTVGENVSKPNLVIETPNGTNITSCVDDYELKAVSDETVSYQWSSGEEVQSIFTRQPGTYTVKVTAADNGCDSTKSVSLTSAIVYPSINLSYNPDSKVLTCAQTSISVTAQGVYAGSTDFSYAFWKVGTTDSTYQATNAVSEAATYTYRVTENNSSCSTDSLVVITENKTKPVVTIDADTSVIDCNIKSIELRASSTTPSVSFVWDNTYLGETYTVNAAGTYQVVATDSNNGCASDAASFAVTENKTAPTVALNAPTSALTCSLTEIELTATATDVTYKWTGDTDFGTTNTKTVSAKGDYQVIVKSTINGCMDSTSINITEDKAKPNLVIETPNGTDITSCVSDYELKAVADEAITAYKWSTGAETQSIFTRQQGEYKVTATAADNGCDSTATVTMTASISYPSINLSYTPNTKVLTCAQPSIDVAAQGVYVGSDDFSYTFWKVGATDSTHSSYNTVEEPATYTYRVTENGSQCYTDSLVVITENKTKPQVSLTVPSSVLNCIQQEITLKAESTTPSVQFMWSDQSTADTLLVTAQGTYKVVATDPTNGCASDEASAVITEDKTAPTILNLEKSALKFTCDTTEITLTATAENVVYKWTGDDDYGTSNTKQVTTKGDYQLEVKSNINGCTNNASISLDEDKEVPDVELTSDYQKLTCDTTSVTLTAVASNVQYSWDGGTSFGLINTKSTTEPVVQTVIVKSTVNGCTNQDSKQIDQDIDQPDVDLEATATQFTCDLQTITLRASSRANVAYKWTGSQVYEDIDTLDVSLGANLDYEVSVKDKTNGCINQKSITLGVDTISPSLNLKADYTTITCDHPQVQLTAEASNVSYLWTGATAYSSENTLNVDQPGLYDVTVKSNQNACTKSASINIALNVDTPAIIISAPIQQITCAQPSVSLSTNLSPASDYDFEWSNGSTQPTITVDQAADYSVRVKVKANGCYANADKVTISDVRSIPVVSITPDAPVLTCDATSVILTVQVEQIQDYTVKWIGSLVPTADNQVSQAGTYTVNVTDNSNGCLGEASVIVSEDKKMPKLDIKNTATEFGCSVKEITLTATTDPGLRVVWNGTADSQITVTEAGVYEAFVSNPQNGCITSKTIELTGEAHDSISAWLTATPNHIIIGNVTELDANYDGDLIKVSYYQNDQELTEYNEKPYTNTTYKMVVEGVCNTVTVSADVTVDWPTMFMPYPESNATTPNRSFVMDMSKDGSANFKTQIFSRYGTLISDSDNGWDGTSCGKLVMPGVYYYIVNLPDGTVRKGTIEVYK